MKKVLGICLLAAWFAGAAPVEATEPIPPAPRALRVLDCVQIALEQSPRLTVARENTAGAQANLRRSYSSYMPQATITTVHGRSGGVSFIDTSAGTIPVSTAAIRHDADLILSQAFWQTGRRELLDQAKANFQATRFAQETTRQVVIQSVAQAYYSALAAKSLVEVARANLKAFQGNLEMVKARVEVGEVARMDLAPAEADVANAELRLIQAENNAEVALARLKNEMGMSPTFALTLADTFSPGKTVLPSLPQALSVAYEKRPEVASSKATVEVNLQALKLAQSREGPLISVAGQYDEGLSRDLQRTAWSFLAGAQVFLYDGGARKSDVQIAKANLGAAEGQHQGLLNNVGLEVETARLTVETAQKSIEAASKTVERAQAQLEAAEGKYQEGMGIYLEITQAQSTLTQAQINLVQAILDYHQALVNLQRALGTLSPATLPPPGGAS